MADLISVIVPVFNVAKDLPRCLDSILAQKYPNIEIIAVDDGSTDDSGMLLDNYSQKYSSIQVIHTKNCGVTNARLRGVAAASGKWIGFVDGDDEIEAEMYERLMKNAQQYQSDISHCGYQMIFPDGRIHYFHNTGHLMLQDRMIGLEDLLSGSPVEPGLCNKLFRKTLFHNLINDNLMDLSIKINEDLLMNFYLFLQAKQSVFEDICPYHYIVRPISASRQKLNQHKIYDPIKVKELILAIAPANVKVQAQHAFLSTCINIYNSIILANQPEFENDRINIRQKIISHINWAKYLSKKQYLLAWLIHHIPSLYKPIYQFYVAHIQKSAYY